ncbi:kinase-like domain-containing protein, partial [Gautieria morchelliformis]
HPVKLGDCFSTLPAGATLSTNPPPSSSSPRYRILHKLGSGSFATVWLARDLLPPGRFVALKIVVAELYGGTREAHVLKIVAGHHDDDHDSGTMMDRGSRHVLSLLDSFQIEGPNGLHDVLVTDVVAPLSALARYPIYQKLRNSFIHQALMGVSYLHQHGIAHGGASYPFLASKDLHIENLGCTLPGLDDHTEENILGHFVAPACTVVLTVDPTHQTPSLPLYLVEPISMVDYIMKKAGPNVEIAPPLLKILDFGGAFQVDEPRALIRCTSAVHPPEVVFPKFALGITDPDWDMRGDIWSLACTVRHPNSLKHGGWPLFSGWGGAVVVLEQMARIVEHLPPAWAPIKFLRRQVHYSAESSNAEWTWRRDRWVEKCNNEQEVDHLIDLLRSMLVLDPAERPSALQLLKPHTWLDTDSPNHENALTQAAQG